MSRRQAANNTGGGNRIRGPHSALTDYLAANNISAAQIRDDYERRRANAQQQAEADGEDAGEGPSAADTEAAVRAAEEAAAKSRKRKKAEKEAIAKIKKGKEFKKKSAKGKGKGKKRKGSDDEESDDDYDEDLARDMYKKKQPLPGQLENCEICSKRFTVTPYSKTGPDGGLLCAPCGKAQTADDKKSEKAAKKAPAGRKRRKVESDRLDGLATHGAKSLVDLCIDKIGQYHDSVEELGDLPDNLVDRLSMVYSKKRVLKPKTLPLFVRPDMREVYLHDAAYLEVEDYDKVFSTAQKAEKIVIRNACQFKDQSLSYMMEKAPNIKYLQLNAANLVSDEMWERFFEEYTNSLEAIKLSWLDAAFDDDTVQVLVQNHPDLTRLKFKRCRRITGASIDWIARLKKLEHLSLQMTNIDIGTERLVELINQVGPTLRTLSLEHFVDANDDVLDAIHNQCRHLTKFRLTENDYCNDAGFTALFTDWANTSLKFVDLNSTRDCDNSNPEGPDEPVGLASNGFRALMAHSGEKLAHLDIASCRHISLEAFMDVFDGQKRYPELKEINISFCNVVDSTVMAGIFRSCPNIRKVVAFGCFNIEDIVVPAGVVVIGVPKAQDALENFGNALVSMDDVMREMNAMIPVGA